LFWSLKKVFIDEKVSTTIDLYSFAPMLMLPNVESIHVAALCRPSAVRLKDLQNLLQLRSSSVQHLSFGGGLAESIKLIMEFALSVRKLKTLMVHGRHRLHDILGPLKALEEPSLEALVSCSKSSDVHPSLNWGPPRSPWAMNLLARFTTIRVLTLDL
jgi:hypothetical protein